MYLFLCLFCIYYNMYMLHSIKTQIKLYTHCHIVPTLVVNRGHIFYRVILINLYIVYEAYVFDLVMKCLILCDVVSICDRVNIVV